MPFTEGLYNKVRSPVWIYRYAAHIPKHITHTNTYHIHQTDLQSPSCEGFSSKKSFSSEPESLVEVAQVTIFHLLHVTTKIISLVIWRNNEAALDYTPLICLIRINTDSSSFSLLHVFCGHCSVALPPDLGINELQMYHTRAILLI